MTEKQLPSKKTKIVCTIGPASDSRDTLEEMIRSGMNVARLNFAHGDLDSHRRAIESIRAAASSVGQRVSIMGDLPGPKMRIGHLADESVELERGQSFILQTEEIEGNSHRASLSFGGLPEAVTPGDKVFINDGFIELEVCDVRGEEVHCRVVVGGELRSHKGVNLPGIDLGISAFTEHDRELLRFASEQGLDAISQSFVQEAADIQAVRAAAAALDYAPFIIAKIERSRAVENLDAILESADGIMVARGDLGVEIPIEEIALAQKHIIRRSNLFGRPVITATHMLESMVTHRRPTRAEATDVANAILDGTDCLMLSGETAAGSHPVEAVAVMTRIARVTEPHCRTGHVAQLLESEKARRKIGRDDLISLSIHLSVETLSPEAVVTPTLSGATARRVSRFRLPVWIIAVSPNGSTCQGLQVSYGVFPVHETTRPLSWERYTRDWLARHGVDRNLALLTLGAGTGHTGGTNQIEVVDLDAPQVATSIW
jgi:pyruvate kinase